MNYASLIVKIVKDPEQNFFKDNTVVTKMVGKFVPTRKRNSDIEDTFQISIWENLSYETIKYYQLNDYIFVEGYISLKSNFYGSIQDSQLDKRIEISVFRHYPLLLT